MKLFVTYLNAHNCVNKNEQEKHCKDIYKTKSCKVKSRYDFAQDFGTLYEAQ